MNDADVRDAWTTLISARELNRLVSSRGAVVFDCRFSLSDVQAGRLSYEEQHIHGAFYAHLDDDLSSRAEPGVTGRHPLPDPGAFGAFLSQRGVSNGTQVVCYDDTGGAIASRLWWLCKWIGIDRVAVLDGGLQAWIAAEYAMQVVAPAFPADPGRLGINPRTEMVADADVVATRVGSISLVDARGAARFRGEDEPIDPVAGHIPGAISLPFTDNLADGFFRDVDSLRSRFAGINRSGDGATICYCGSGVTAAHDILAIVHAGYPMPRLYAGSWSDWIVDAGRPVAVGEE